MAIRDWFAHLAWWWRMRRHRNTDIATVVVSPGIPAQGFVAVRLLWKQERDTLTPQMFATPVALWAIADKIEEVRDGHGRIVRSQRIGNEVVGLVPSELGPGLHPAVRAAGFDHLCWVARRADCVRCAALLAKMEQHLRQQKERLN